MKNHTNSNVNLLPTSLMASLVILTALLTACASNKPSYQDDKKYIVKNAQGVPNYYRVKREDTISKIAEKFGLNYRQIAHLNELDSKYTIYSGQWLKLWGKTHNNYAKRPSNNSNNAQKTASNNGFDVNKSTGYQYPTKNKVIRHYGIKESDGMWFKGKVGDPVYATGFGKVLYAGSGLQEFGNLIMIRHEDNLITAYAHNSRLLVQDGAYVKRGQKIATMGKTGSTKRVGLQFQVRRGGTAIDPRTVLGKR